jgi:5-methylcytosine-specific restriction endonuclease McrA
MVTAAEISALGASVLVLNRSYVAIHIVHVKRALCLLVRDLAEVIHVENGRFANYDFESWLAVSLERAKDKGPHDDWIRAVRFEIQAPRVIRLLKYERHVRMTVHFNRRNIFARDGHRCMYCGRRYPLSQLSLDHVVPKSRGGNTDWDNVVCSCLPCNARKGGRTPQEARMKLVQRPVRPQRNPLLSLKLRHPKYHSWRAFIEPVHWPADAE